MRPRCATKLTGGMGAAPKKGICLPRRVRGLECWDEYLTEWGDFHHPMDIDVDRQGRAHITDQIPRLSQVGSRSRSFSWLMSARHVRA